MRLGVRISQARVEIRENKYDSEVLKVSFKLKTELCSLTENGVWYYPYSTNNHATNQECKANYEKL